MSRPATSRLKVNAPLGSPPTLEWRAVGELQIDPTYQRSIDTGPSQALIRKIAMFWDWGLCQPLAVSRRPSGALAVVDGQHRVSAAKLRGDIPHLPCVITSYPNAGDEAAAFVALNQMRRPLSALDLFKAAVAAEDKESLLILDCLTSAGLSLAPHSNHTAWKPGMVANIGGLRRVLQRDGGEQVIRTALAVLGKAFPGQIMRYAGTLFPGLAAVAKDELRLRASSDEIVGHLAPIVASKSQAEWRQIIKVSIGTSGGMAREASELVFRQVWRSRHLAAPPELPGEIPPTATIWCQQCDQRVSGAKANVCTSPFCKARAQAA